MKYTIYDKTTGEILRNVSCSPDDLALQYDPITQNVIEGSINDTEFYIQNNQPVAFPVKPSEVHTFDWTTKQWVDLRTLEQVKVTKWEALKKDRQAATEVPLVTPYGTFDADPRSQKAITDAVLMLQTLQNLGTPTVIDFTLADNSVVTLTTAQMVNVGLLLGQQVQAAHSKGRLKRQAIDAATTTEQVESVVW